MPVILNNERGSLAIDFIFAFVLIFGFVTLLFSIALTLTAVEMTQYMTFAAARKYHASHINEDKQREVALAKYQEIYNDDAYRMLTQGSWFEVFENPFIGDVTQNPSGGLSDYDQGGSPNLFHGVVTLFTAKVLSFGLGSFGSTAPDDDPGDGSSFATHIGSYLGREPTSSECNAFNADRWRAIRDLTVNGGAAYSTGTSEAAYVVISDNGC
ncbi:MAG: hypothetical protein AAF202_06935 [Pseudomonadota bacterium]